MNEAIKRHEQNVRKVQELRKIQEDDFRQQVDMEGDIIKLENDQVNYKKTKLNEDLKEQIRQNEIKNKFEFEQEKKPVATNGGPVVPERSIVIQKFKNKQALTKLELERQMQVRENEQKNKRDIELTQERKESELNQAKHLEDRKNQMQKMQEQKAHFAEIWAAQKNIKQVNDHAENAF